MFRSLLLIFFRLDPVLISTEKLCKLELRLLSRLDFLTPLQPGVF